MLGVVFNLRPPEYNESIQSGRNDSSFLFLKERSGHFVKKYHIYLILVGVMLAWGFNVIALKVLVSHFMPATMTAFRVLTAGAAVLVILASMKQMRWPTKQEWIYVGFGSLFNVVLHHYFLSIGLSRTTASNGGLILGLGPLLTTILAVTFLGDKATFSRALGVVIGFTGVSFVVLEGHHGMGPVSLGDWYVFLAILVQAASFILIKNASKTMDPRLMTGYMFLIGAPILLVVSLILEPQGLASMGNASLSVWLVFMASAILATALGHLLYNYAIGQIGAAESSIFINLNPLFALIGSFLFLGEDIGLVQISGFIFILFGVLLGSGAIEDRVRYLKQRA